MARSAVRAAPPWLWPGSTARGVKSPLPDSEILRRKFIRAPSCASIWFRSTAPRGIKCSAFGSSVIRGRTDGMLVLHSDGLATATSVQDHPGLALRDPSLNRRRALSRFLARQRRFHRGRRKGRSSKMRLSQYPFFRLTIQLRARYGRGAPAGTADCAAAGIRCPGPDSDFDGGFRNRPQRI